MHLEPLTLSRHPALDEVVSLAESFVGVPWRAGAHTPQGMDCLGLVIAITLGMQLYKEEEIEVPNYSQIPTGHVMLHTLAQWLKRVPRPMLGGLTTFSQPGTGLYHVGVLGDDYLYHAGLENKKVVKVTLSPVALKDRKASFVFERPTEHHGIGSPLTEGGKD